jgi:hypothetical protein
MAMYAVQIIVVREITVEANDELQAERESYQQLDDGAAIAIRVQESDDSDGGALAEDDNHANWRLAKEQFHAIDREWVAGG